MVFRGDADFLACQFLGKTQFRCVADGMNVRFIQSHFTEAEFEQFSKEEPAYIDFTDTELTEKVVFKNINFTHTRFYNTDLIDARFKSCVWGDTSINHLLFHRLQHSMGYTTRYLWSITQTDNNRHS